MKEDSRALVTVIALCYNQAPFVVESLESVRRQTYGNMELIITDDFSRDGSAGIIKRWIEDNRVECVFIAHNENRGMTRTLNEALSAAKGKYVSFIAADDVWMPSKIERLTRRMEELPEDVGVVFSDTSVIDEKGRTVSPSYYPARFKAPEGDIFTALIEENPISASYLIRRSCYEKVGMYDERLLYEDWDMWLRIARQYKFIFVPETLAKYRIVANSAWHKVSASKDFQLTQFLIFSKHIDSPGPDTAKRKMLIGKLHGIALSMYESGCDKRNYYLWKLVKYARSPFAVMMFVFSSAGIPYSLYKKIFKRLVSIKKAVCNRP